MFACACGSVHEDDAVRCRDCGKWFREPPAKPGVKVCAWCKSEIPEKALLCRFCGKDPSQLAVTGDALQKIGSGLTLLITLPVLLLIAMAYCGSR